MLNVHEEKIVYYYRRLLSQALVVLDLETTGEEFTDEAFQIGGVFVDNGVLGHGFNYICKPKRAMHPKAQSVHGITNAMLDGLPDFKAHAPQLGEQLAGRIVCAYGAKFDQRLLWQTYVARGLVFPLNHWECLADSYAVFAGERLESGLLRTPRLVEACRRHKVQLTTPHEALADAKAAALLLLEVARIQTNIERQSP